jgi:hypothetical protein
MAKPSASVYARVGLAPEERLRWLLNFGNLEPASLNAARRAAAVQEARAFLMVEQVDPEVRPLLRAWPPPKDDTPKVLTVDEVWAAQRWLMEGLELLRRTGRWDFAARVRYELDLHRGLMLWARLRSNSRLEQFKALAYNALREARFWFRLCPECQRPFVPVRRQAYCSAGCSQAVRTRKWRTKHPEKNRAIRRRQYQRSKAASSGPSEHAAIKIKGAKSHQRPSR